MIPLARALLEQGDSVGWATAAEFCPRLVNEGFEAMPAGLGGEAGLAEFLRRFPEVRGMPARERPPFMFPRMFGALRARPMLNDLLPIARQWKPSLIVHEAAEFAGPVAAARLGVPSVSHSFGALLPPERVMSALVHVAPLWEAHGLDARPYGGFYEHLYLDIYPKGLGSAEAAHVPFVQALRPVAFALPGDDPLPEWLGPDDSRPIVYVTFGTVFNTDVKLFAAVVEAIRTLAVRVIVTVGQAGNPAALGPQPANVHVARYVPQMAILRVCSVVVSHAGSGTFLAALARGLPQVCLPQAADQFGNAEACAAAGAGLAIEPGGATVESVREATARVLAEPSFRAAAQRLSQEITMMPSPDAVAGILKRRFAAQV
jgi:UDP:flavonoid glycosyltransferase YjiC (YdhE family)